MPETPSISPEIQELSAEFGPQAEEIQQLLVEQQRLLHRYSEDNDIKRSLNRIFLILGVLMAVMDRLNNAGMGELLTKQGLLMAVAASVHGILYVSSGNIRPELDALVQKIQAAVPDKKRLVVGARLQELGVQETPDTSQFDKARYVAREGIEKLLPYILSLIPW